MADNSPPTRPIDHTPRAHWLAGLGLAAVACTVLVAGLLASPGDATAAEAPVGLGTAGAFSVLGGQSVTNTGPSVIGDDLGVSPGTSITGFPPGIVLGTIHATDAVAGQAQSDLVVAYNDAAGRAPSGSVPGELGGLTLVGGVYNASSSTGLTGTLTLDAQGDPNTVWIFQVGSTLTTASASSVTLINGASACNVFWQIGSSATLGTHSDFVGTIMAMASISVTTGTDVIGRALARTGSVTLDDNTFTTPTCESGPTSTTTTTDTSDTTTDTTSDTTSDTTTDTTTTTSDTTTTTTDTDTTTSDTTTTTPTDTTTTTSDSDTTTTTTPTDTTTTTTDTTSDTTSPTTTTRTRPTHSTTKTKPTHSTTTRTRPTHSTTSKTHPTHSSTTTSGDTTTPLTTTTTPALSTDTTTSSIGLVGGGGGGGGGGGSPVDTGSGSQPLAYTGTSSALGPVIGLGVLLIALGGLLLLVRRTRRQD